MAQNNQPFLSVVIPSINEEKYLPRCLSSIAQQTYKNYEIIVSDGGSTDKTVEIAKKYGAKVVVNKNTNVTQARQKGAEVATGEIIVCADADTTYHPNRLEKIVYDFQKDERIVAVGGGGIFEKKPLWYYIYWKIFYFFLTWIWKIFKVALYIPALNLSFKREAFKKIGEYNVYLDFGGDELDIVARLKKVGKVYFDPDLIAFPSSRRATVGFLKFFFKQFLIDYLFNYYVAKLFKKTIIKAKPVR